jgi:hypothetical protein
LFPEGETEGRCPVCDVELQPMAKLPPSFETAAEHAARLAATPPEYRLLPWTYLGRGRGALMLVALLGLVAFFLPWVEVTKPYDAVLSGFDFARGRAGWLWGGAVAWFVMFPLVATRRSIAGMRGVRIITGLFAAMTLGEVAMLVTLPPHGRGYVSYEYSWGVGLYASAIISALGIFFATRFGGRLDDLPAAPWKDPQGVEQIETSEGETLH